MYFLEALGTAVFFTFAGVACDPPPVDVGAYRASYSAAIASYNAAIRPLGMRDLGCSEVLSVGTIDVDVKTRFGGSVSFGAVDGCGHRALYTRNCQETASQSTHGVGYSMTCTPSLFGVLELGRGDPPKSASVEQAQ